MSKIDISVENEVNVDLEKRKFMTKFGKYAVVGVGMGTLMTPNASASFNSGCKRVIDRVKDRHARRWH